jgi:hypothetical protein
MSPRFRYLLAVLIVAADAVAIVVPLAAVFAAYVVVARPPWFLRWVLRLYEDRGLDA